MQRFPILLAAGAVLSGCAAPAANRTDLSCAEYADRRAGQQYAAETDALSDRQSGVQESALQRDFARMDAESYRARTYRDCVRVRAGPDEPPPPTPNGG